MTGRAELRSLRARLISGALLIPAGRFERAGGGKRVRCTLCHVAGLGLVEPDAHSASPWQVSHMRKHWSPCHCGLTFLSPGHLRQHIAVTRYPARAAEHWPVLPESE